MGRKLSQHILEERRTGEIHKRVGRRRVMEERDGAALIAAIPADTRTARQRFFGDPIPGRSALDQKRREALLPPAERRKLRRQPFLAELVTAF